MSKTARFEIHLDLLLSSFFSLDFYDVENT